MPRTKLTMRKNEYTDLGILINGVVRLGEMEAEVIAKKMGVKSATSARKYMRNPELLPLNRLLKLCKTLDIPIDKVKECLRY